jgi:hypothetical protein
MFANLTMVLNQGRNRGIDTNATTQVVEWIVTPISSLINDPKEKIVMQRIMQK